MMTGSHAVHAVALVLAGAMTRRSAEAQVCHGAAPFSNGVVRIGALIGGTADVVRDGDGSFGLQLAAGAAHGFFASVSSSAVLYRGGTLFVRDGLAARETDDAAALVTSLTGGYAIPVSASRNVELCPIVGYARQSGPSWWSECTPGMGGCGGELHGQGRAFWFGGSIGFARFSRTSAYAFVPFAGGAYFRSKLTATGGGGSMSATSGYFGMTAGAGLVIKRLTIRPTISFPVGLDGGRRTTGIELAFNVGPKARPAASR